MTELVAAFLVLAGLLILAAAVFVRGGRAHDGGAPQVDRTSVELLQRQIEGLQQATTATVGEMRGELQRTLAGAEERMGTQGVATQRALTDLARQLGELGEKSQRIGDLAREVGTLHDLLRVPQPRGGFGELMLERLLADSLPAEAFALQHSFREGLRVDAVVRTGGMIVPIDAKFPLEPFQALAAAQTDEERRAKRRAFLQTVKRHVDAVSRYVRPDEGTVDIALLYIPAEQVFYAAFVQLEEGDDLRAYCAQRHVVPVSPNTLVAYLQLVALGLRGLAIEQRSRDMHEQIRRAALELERFRELYDQLGKHVENASKKWTESLRTLDRATDAVETLGQTQLAAPAQPTLALELSSADRPTNGHGSRVGADGRS